MLRGAHTDELHPTLDTGRSSNWVTDVAARHARRQCVGVTVVLPRAPGAVAAVRQAAEACGVDVTTTIAPHTITARFEARAGVAVSEGAASALSS